MINPNIKKIDILKALDFIDKNGVPSLRKSTKYNLVHNEKNYPPKYVISIAHKFLTGIELDNELFSGGKETNNFLLKRGFIIEGKTPLKSIIQLKNYADYKLHLATGEKDKTEALIALKNGTFDDFQNQQSKRNFRREYILALVYMETEKWLFAGIYESSEPEMHPTDKKYPLRYKTILTNQYKEYIGRLVIKYHKKIRPSYLKLEKFIDDLAILKILNTSLLDADATQNRDRQTNAYDYYQRAYRVTKRYIDEKIDLPLKEAKQLIAGNGNHNTANYHIYGIKGLLKGEKFTPKLTEEPLDFYISLITREFGIIGFKKAVIALEKNLQYRIDLGEPSVTFKKFVKKYRKELNLLEDEIEQAEILQEIEQNNPSKASLIEYFKNLKPSEQKKVAYSGGKAYKRDNVIVANLKKLRDFTCQICKCQIKKADGSFYIEAAHIHPKAKAGEESPRNLLILCPNHHKEFDYGQREILIHTDEEIEFRLNGVEHKIYIGLT